MVYVPRTEFYRPEIDGLRAIALLAVMFYHAAIPGFSGGYTGVDIFFVLSGYLITRIIVRERTENKFSLTAFWIRRARRILPALFAVMFICIPFAWIFMDPGELQNFGASLSASSLFSANFYFWKSTGGYFALSVDRMPLIHLWSLAVEEQFYLIYPVLLLVLWKMGSKWIAFGMTFIFLASLLLSEIASYYRPTANFFLLPTRVWELLAGAGLAFAEIRGLTHHIERRIPSDIGVGAGLILIICPFFLLDDASRFPGLHTIPTILGTCLVVRYANASGLGAFLGLRPIVGVGLVSYSAYLFHQPVLVFSKIVSLNAIPLTGRLGLLAFTLILAALSWRFFENPVRRKVLLTSSRSIILASVGSIALLFTMGFLLWSNNGFPERLSNEQRRLADMNKLYSDAMLPCFFAPGVVRDFSTACHRGPSDAPVKIALLGDSHAAALAPGFDTILAQNSVRLVQFVAAGCPPVLDMGPLSKYQQHCAEFNRKVVENLKSREDISTVILHGRWAYYIERRFFDNGEGGVEIGPKDDWPEMRQEAMTIAFKDMVDTLVAGGKKVVIVYPVPEPGWDVPRYLIQAQRLGIALDGGPSTSYQRFSERNARAYKSLDWLGSSDKIIRIYPARNLCNRLQTYRCSLVAGGFPLYFDDDHLNTKGAQIALEKTVIPIPK